MTHTEDTRQPAAHTPEPWDHDMDFIVAPDPTGQHPDIYIAEIAHSDDEGRVAPPDQQGANRRRICAAVNACRGLSTEALEQGVIATLRYALGELLTAAGDLEASIDGATDQFSAERARLNAALRAAQAVLDGGTEIELHEVLAARGQTALGWSVEDVQEVRPDLTDEQAWEVLRQVERRHDATIGITWDTLEWVAEDLFGDAPETDAPEGQP